MENFIQQLPKVELHAHLNGSLSIQTLNQLSAVRCGNESSHLTFTNLSNFEKMSLKECFQKFKIAHYLTSTSNSLKLATILAIKDFAQDNVIYLEIRTTPRETEFMSRKEYLQAVLVGIEEASMLYPSILVKLLPSIDRSQGVEAAREISSLVLDTLKDNRLKNIIKGIDFSGNPEKGNFEHFKDILNKLRNTGLKIAVHCGEVENNTEIRDMLLFGMDRCGHGTFLYAENLDLLINKNIPVECCLSSNVACGTVKNFNEHHFRRLFNNNHPVVICTDDFGVFGSNLSSELIIASRVFALKTHDLLELTLNAVNFSFASIEEKNELRRHVKSYFNNL